MEHELLKRYSLTEIALLAVFVLGIGLAYIIVKVRQQVRISEPVALFGSGLSVSMPTNPGWEYETAWRYESDNSMALVAKHQRGRFRDASVQWRYHLSCPEGSAREILERRIQQAGTKYSSIETLAGTVDMDYTIVDPDDTDQPFFLGFARLDFGRCLELRVYPQDADEYYAETLFRSLASGVQYEQPEQLQRGKELTGDFWNSLKVNKRSFNENSEDAFLIKSPQEETVGYSHSQYTVVDAEGIQHPQLSVDQYEQNFMRVKSSLQLQTDRLFTWTTSFQRIGMNKAQSYTISNGPDGIVQVHSDFEEDRQFATDFLFVPELLLPEYVALLLDLDMESIIVDILLLNGIMVPAQISHVDISEAFARSEDIAYVIRINFLNRRESMDELYYDTDKRLIGQFEKQPLRQRLWERTSPDNLEKLFKDIKPVEDQASPVDNKETINT